MSDQYPSGASHPFSADLPLTVRGVRQARNITIETLAAKTGIPTKQLAAIEAGRSRPTYYEVWRLAAVLEVQEARLLRCLGMPAFYRAGQRPRRKPQVAPQPA